MRKMILKSRITTYTTTLRQLKVVSLLALLISIISCNRHQEIGVDIKPQDERLGVYFSDTFSLQTEVVLYDSILANSPPWNMVGKASDVDFGTIESNFYTNINPSIFLTSAPENDEFDSLLLIISTNGYYAGDTSSPIDFDVFYLNDTLNRETSYFTKSSVALGDKLGSYSVNPGSLSTNFAFKIEGDLANTFYTKYVNNEINTDATFAEFIKGLAFINRTSNTGVTGISRVEFQIHHHQTGESDNLIAPFIADISDESFNQINTDRSSGKLAALSNTNPISLSDLEEIGYLQAGSGVRARVHFPSLFNFSEKIGKNVKINSAELFITNLETESNISPPVIYTLSYDGSGSQSSEDITSLSNLIIDPNLDPSAEGNYSQTSDATQTPTFFGYRIILTEYINQVSKGLQPSSIIISPSANDYNINQLKFGSGEHPTSKMRLEVYYSFNDK